MLEYDEDQDDSRALVPVDDPDISLYDPSITESPHFEDDSVKIITEVARDESLANVVYYIEHLSHMDRPAKARLIARAGCFMSKNYVFSNISDAMDLMRVVDDYEYVKKLSRIGLNTFDRNIDYLTAEGLIEAQHSIRIRRSKEALNLKMINTRRQESSMEQSVRNQQEEGRFRSKIPIIGSWFGGRD
ncbi:MAG: hypothetical protein WC489_08370 [Patescibacteria group bacterium]|jgi:hypothetical protein